MARRTSFAFALCSLLLIGGGSVSEARATDGGGWTIVETFPVPEGASGLAYDGTWLYCGIYGPDGGRIYRIDPNTGGHTLLFTGPHEDAFGLTYDGQYLWTTDHPGGSGDPAIAMQLDWDGTLLDSFEMPDHYMSGIAYDNGDFWVARYYPDPSHIYKLDNTGVVLHDFTAPDNQPWDLCLENDHLWMADYWGDALYKIDAVTGHMLESHPSEGVDAAGVVWDGQYLWYCDNGEGGVDFLYKVDLAGGGTPALEIPVDTHDFGNISIGESSTWNVTVNNIGDADLEISDVTFSPVDDLSCTAEFPVTVPVGESTQLPIVFEPGDFGELDAIGAVHSNDPIHPAEELALAGYGVYPNPTIDIAQGSHDYGAVRLNAHTRWFMDVSNHGNQVLTISDITIDDEHYYLDEAVELPFDVNTLETVQVGVWFSPEADVSYPATLNVYSNDPVQNPAPVTLGGSGLDTDYPMGQMLWTYLIDEDYDNSPKAIAPIPDVSGDGVTDVIVCSEDDYVRCFNGNAHGTGDVLWAHEIYAGSIYQQNALQIVPDISEDGYHDVIVGSSWGGHLIRAISGKTGQTIWTHDTREYGDGGWVYQVDCSYDYNDDGVLDVLASTGDDSSDTGPKRVYCLSGLTGVSIWERPLFGPVFGVIGVEDFTGDGQADAVAGASNESETEGKAVGIDGADGTVEWSFIVDGSSVWALEQIDDITSDGIRDVIIGDFGFGIVHGLDATTGLEEYSYPAYGTLTRFEQLDDVNGDGHVDVIGGHFSTVARVISGLTGDPVWSTPLVDKPSSVDRIEDITGDGINDVVVGTLFSTNYAYFLDGVDGSVLDSFNFGTPVDAIASIPDIVGDNSHEMVVGGRNGRLTCYSGGFAGQFDPADVNQDGVVDFADLLLLLAAWGPCEGCPEDINNDGTVDFADLLLILANWT